MNSKSILLLIAVTVFVVFSGMSQNGKDISVLLSDADHFNPSIEFRQEINAKYKYKVGANFLQRHNYFSGNKQLVSASDSLILYRVSSGNPVNRFGVLFGVERKLKASVFSIGSDLIFVYSNEKKKSYFRKEVLTPYGWENEPYDFIPFQDHYNSGHESVPAKVTRHFLMPSLRLRVLMDLPITSKLYFTANYNLLFNYRYLIKETDKVDPLYEFHQIPANRFFTSDQFGIGLRYKLK